MTWQQVLGHEEVIERFRRGLRLGRLASSYLFVGPPGVGKHTFALKLAEAFLCETAAAAVLDPCGRCSACQQVQAGTHPDLIHVGKPADKSYIPVELFIGDREHRMREGMCHDISLKPFRGGRKIAIIDDADFMNQEGANCLLKTLEEPPRGSMVILISTSEQRQLPTIRSRCQVVRFRPLDPRLVAQLLVARQLVDDSGAAERAATRCEGSLKRALELADPEADDFRQRLLQQLSRPHWDSRELAASVSSFVDQAGKEAPPRRARMREVLQMASDFYRHLLRGMCGAAAGEDSLINQAVASSLPVWQGDTERVVLCQERCLDAIQHVAANANQATLLECWLDDLRQIQLGRPVAVYSTEVTY